MNRQGFDTILNITQCVYKENLHSLIMVTLWNRADHYIFILSFVLSSSFFLFFLA